MKTAPKQSERQYRDLFEQAPVMNVITDNQRGVPIVVDCNGLFLRTLGYARAEVMGRRLADFYSSSSRRKMMKGGGYQRALRGKFVDEERELVARDGRVVKTLLRAVPTMASGGRVSGTCAMYIDITDRKRAQEALRMSEASNRAFLEAIPDMIFHVRKDGTYLGYKPGKEVQPYVPPREFLGKKVSEVLPAEVAGLIMQKARQALKTGHTQVAEYELAESKGRRAYETRFARVGKEEVLAIVQDITERKRAEEERKRMEQVLRDFVANVSHELRTPLTAIQGSAETLLDGDGKNGEESREFLRIIIAHSRRLKRLTDDLLCLSQIDAGKLEMEESAVCVADLIRSCALTAQACCEKKRLKLRVECQPGLPNARGDARFLREIIQNLLDNAVQYTPPGGRITVHSDVGKGEIVLAVSDTGIGIPRQEQARIFERFYRVDSARSREAGGTGLGLSIARQLVKAHGGRLEVESEVGRGSTFKVFLPTWKD